MTSDVHHRESKVVGRPGGRLLPGSGLNDADNSHRKERTGVSRAGGRQTENGGGGGHLLKKYREKFTEGTESCNFLFFHSFSLHFSQWFLFAMCYYYFHAFSPHNICTS